MLTKKSALVIVCVLSGVLFLTACRCCGPHENPSVELCVVCPVQPTPTWKEKVDAGDYAIVITETTRIIDEGKGAPEYAQALLYRGVAEFRLGTDLKAARDDLGRAQDLVSQMTVEDQTLLFRSQMVVLARLGDQSGAEQAFQQALKISPEDQKDAIRTEYKNALNPW